MPDPSTVPAEALRYTHLPAGLGGVVWCGTAGRGGGGGGGAACFDGTAWMSYWEADGLVSNNVSDIVITPDGMVWFGTTQIETAPTMT